MCPPWTNMPGREAPLVLECDAPACSSSISSRGCLLSFCLVVQLTTNSFFSLPLQTKGLAARNQDGTPCRASKPYHSTNAMHWPNGAQILCRATRH